MLTRPSASTRPVTERLGVVDAHAGEDRRQGVAGLNTDVVGKGQAVVTERFGRRRCEPFDDCVDFDRCRGATRRHRGGGHHAQHRAGHDAGQQQRTATGQEAHR